MFIERETKKKKMSDKASRRVTDKIQKIRLVMCMYAFVLQIKWLFFPGQEDCFHLKCS